MRCATLGLLLVLPLIAGCGLSKQTRGDLAVRLVTEPSPPRVGDIVLRARLSSRGGQAISAEGVRYYYYPFVQRDKDSLASPDEVVRVVEGARSQDEYRANAKFDKPGPWKVTLRVLRSGQPDALLTFTFDVRA